MTPTTAFSLVVRLGRRLLDVAITLVVASMLIFGAMHAAPGDPAVVLVGGPQKATPENLETVRAQYHLDDPLPVQYATWLGDVLHGDLGRSFYYGDQVVDLIGSRLTTTLFLVGYASLIFLVLGVTLGVWSALRRGAVDSAVLVGTTFAGAVPGFVAAVLLIGVFAVQLGWFPVSGGGDGFWSRVHHLTLPAISLAIGALALITRVTRQTTLEQLSADHVDVARNRGLTERLVIRRHVLRTSVGPVLTMSGIVIASMLAGTVVIEEVFGLSGIGSLLVGAIDNNDMPVTQAVLLVMVVAYVVVTSVTDLARRALDPRLREVSS